MELMVTGLKVGEGLERQEEGGRAWLDALIWAGQRVEQWA